MTMSRLQKEYALFVNNFLTWAAAAGAIVHVPKRGNVVVSDLGGGRTEVCSILHLENWPFKGATKKANGGLSILLRTREVYEQNNILVKSNVNTMYFKPVKRGLPACPEIAIHYDYKHRMDEAHPVFHAQFGALEVPGEDLASVNFDRQLDVSSYRPIKSIRIPTVHVGLPAALLALSADHLSRIAYYGFLEFASKNAFFNDIAALRLDSCREKRLHDQDQWVYRSHNVYM